MATKMHVGFRDGQLVSGKCEADKGKCPYGNHFASQSESDAYKEHVAGILYSPQYRDLAAGFEAMGASSNGMTTQAALANGFPEEIAKLIGGEPTDPRYARENVGKELEDDSLKELREALSGNLGDGTDDDDDYEPPASMSEAIDEFMAKQEAPLREALGGETHSLPHRSIPEGIDLETEEGAAKFMEVLSSYKMSAIDDFKELPPTLDRHGYSYSYGDRNGDYYKSLEEGYQNFSVALTAMRTGQTDQLNVEERAIASDYEDEFKRLNEAADTAYKGVSGDRDTRAWRSITDYGEEGNQVNDAIMQNMMIQYAGDSNPYFRKEAYNHINADVIHNDGIDSSEAWERYMGDVSPDELSKLGLKPEVELNKLRHQLYAEKYGDALKDASEAKHEAARKSGPAKLEDIKASIKANTSSLDQLKNSPISKNFYLHDASPAVKAYHKEAGAKLKAKVKPGAYVMLNDQDALVYKIGEDGSLRAPNGALWGHVNLKTGAMHDLDGTNLLHSGGARVYSNEDELYQYAALDNGGHFRAGRSSADPGIVSAYEGTGTYGEVFNNVTNYLKERESALTEQSRRNRELADGVDSMDVGKLYDVARKQFGMPAINKSSDALKAGNEDKLKREVRKYLKGQIDSGKVEFDATSKEFKASKREPVKQYNEAEDMKRILSGHPDISPETRVSIMNSARRKRDMITAQADQFAGAFEPRITEYNPVASRRVNWNSESVKVADAEKGNLIISNTPNNDGTRDTYVVVDDKKGLMVQIRENLTPMDRLSDPDGSRASAFQATTSEYAIQNVLRRYEMEDQTLNVQPISDKNRYGDKLHVW